MFGNYFAINHDAGLLALRVGIAAIFFAHGAMKLRGIPNVIGFFEMLHIPFASLNAWFIALLESVGAVLLMAGFGTPVLALLFIGDMLVAIVKGRIGLMKSPFMGTEAAGWEFEFALLIGALALLFTGAGAYSVDALLKLGL